jgi:hypothetical protein
MILVFVSKCESYSQSSLKNDTTICLTAQEMRALLKLKAERDYLKNQVVVILKADSLKSKVILDNDKSIKALQSELSKSQENLNEQIHKKEMWRDATLIGIPVSIIGGLIMSIFI